MWDVARMIQIRDVRPELHAELVRRAKLAGKTLTAFIEENLEREVEQADPREWYARIKSRPPIPLSRPAADTIRQIREEEDQWWDEWWSTRRPSSSS
jgi:hypothetical protein